MKKIAPLFFFITSLQVFAQSSPVNIGPMVGYSQMREAMLWVQTRSEAEVVFKYWPINNPDSAFYTNKVLTNKADAFTAKCIADSVDPGKTYSYQLYVDNNPVTFYHKTQFQTLPIWLWRTDPPEFSFALGSCTYINEAKYDRPGTPYGKDPVIFSSILDKQPDFMMWLGDNIYLREADWHSWTGTVARYSHDRAIKELQPLLASVHHYHIWDDHDFGPNNSDESFWMKDKTLKAFELFTANPSYGVNDIKGITTFFNWNDVDFFLLDNRYHRNPNDYISDNKTILGAEQLDWIKKALVNSKANFKVVAIGGQFLNTAEVHENHINNGFAAERQEIIDFIYLHDIKNVVFINGDRHHSELSLLKEGDNPRILDVTVSPLTSGAARNVTENNSLRVEGTLVEQNNFGTISFSGPIYERKIKFSVFDKNGALLWEREYESEK
jgi:alkaline phosphatase D